MLEAMSEKLDQLIVAKFVDDLADCVEDSVAITKALEDIELERALPRRQYLERTGKKEYCRRCAKKTTEFVSAGRTGVGGKLVEMVFLNDTQANCPECNYGFEWPRPAAELYPDEPWKCPVCHGVIHRFTDATGDNWRCIGFPDNEEGRKMANKAFGAAHAKTLWEIKTRAIDDSGRPVGAEAKAALPKGGCGWTDSQANYGTVWR